MTCKHKRISAESPHCGVRGCENYAGKLQNEVADKAECFAEHSHMAVGDTCTCGFKAEPLEGEFDPPPEPNPTVCQFACDHNCTLVGHAHEAIRFLNQCLKHGITRTAVEGDPEYTKMLDEIHKLSELLLKRNSLMDRRIGI